jgi:hypothetical protein
MLRRFLCAVGLCFIFGLGIPFFSEDAYAQTTIGESLSSKKLGKGPGTTRLQAALGIGSCVVSVIVYKYM